MFFAIIPHMSCKKPQSFLVVMMILSFNIEAVAGKACRVIRSGLMPQLIKKDFAIVPLLKAICTASWRASSSVKSRMPVGSEATLLI